MNAPVDDDTPGYWIHQSFAGPGIERLRIDVPIQTAAALGIVAGNAGITPEEVVVAILTRAVQGIT